LSIWFLVTPSYEINEIIKYITMTEFIMYILFALVVLWLSQTDNYERPKDKDNGTNIKT